MTIDSAVTRAATVAGEASAPTRLSGGSLHHLLTFNLGRSFTLTG
jgi:hypothetical protein